MAAESGDAAPALIRALEEAPHGFSFFQAVRLLERSRPGAARVGAAGPVEQEAVRLRPSSALAFPAADVSAVERIEGEPGPRWRLSTALLGLYGAASPLPAHYSEDVLRAEAAGDDDPGRLFLDVPNHRLLSLLYAAWAKYRWEFTYEAGATDRTSRQVLGFAGVAEEAAREAAGLPPARLLRYAGVLLQRPRGATLVAGAVSDYFGGVPARVEQCVPRWVRLRPEERLRLGASRLGEDGVLGGAVPDRGGKCRLEIGPLDLEDFDAFLPGGSAWRPLGRLVPLLLDDPLEWDLRLSLRGRAVPPLRLVTGEGAVRLGRTSWLGGDGAAGERSEIFEAPPRAA